MTRQVEFLNALHSALGVPYVWGGTNLKSGVDCSGLVYEAAIRAGIKGVPRTSQEQYNYGRPVPIRGLRPGDLVFTEPGPTGPGHVGIYIGNGQVESAPHTGAQVHITQLNQFGTLVGARRILANPQTMHVVNASHYPTPKGQMPAPGVRSGPMVAPLPIRLPQFQNPALSARDALSQSFATPSVQAPSVPVTPAIPLPSSAAVNAQHDQLLRATT